jgi:hypothetical protein
MKLLVAIIVVLAAGGVLVHAGQQPPPPKTAAPVATHAKAATQAQVSLDPELLYRITPHPSAGPMVPGWWINQQVAAYLQRHPPVDLRHHTEHSPIASFL